MSDDDSASLTLHALVGGDQFFVDLVDRFYDDIASDPLLGPMYPDDTAGPRRRLAGFLIQYWGGSTQYSDERGHPRLRMRHTPFRIDEAASDAWLARMRYSLAQVTVPPEAEEAVWEHFVRSAEFLRNSD